MAGNVWVFAQVFCRGSFLLNKGQRAESERLYGLVLKIEVEAFSQRFYHGVFFGHAEVLFPTA